MALEIPRPLEGTFRNEDSSFSDGLVYRLSMNEGSGRVLYSSGDVQEPAVAPSNLNWLNEPLYSGMDYGYGHSCRASSDTTGAVGPDNLPLNVGNGVSFAFVFASAGSVNVAFNRKCDPANESLVDWGFNRISSRYVQYVKPGGDTLTMGRFNDGQWKAWVFRIPPSDDRMDYIRAERSFGIQPIATVFSDPPCLPTNTLGRNFYPLGDPDTRYNQPMYDFHAWNRALSDDEMYRWVRQHGTFDTNDTRKDLIYELDHHPVRRPPVWAFSLPGEPQPPTFVPAWARRGRRVAA